jgi:uncharacterized membrane protein
MKEPFKIPLSLLCIAGTVLSALSTNNHYTTSTTSYCSLDATFNCDIVNRSVYSTLWGVPVALIGLAGYIVLLLLTIVRLNITSRRLRFLFALGGLGFALYLTYIEDQVLHTWCLLCLGSLAAILSITVLSGLALTLGAKTTMKEGGTH